MNNIFLNLSSSNFLVEYIYYDVNNPDIINTDDAPFYFIQNGHTNEPLLMNSDDSAQLTGNVRDRSLAEIDPIAKRYAWLTPNKLGPVYNDYDPELTNSADMDLEFTNTEGVIYDTIRLHLIQGFSFNDIVQGINLSVKVRDKNGKKINLLSGAYLKGENIVTLNPNPFLYGGRQYASYVEFKVPSLRYLIESYNEEYINVGNDDILAFKITDGSGFYQTTVIEIEAGFSAPLTKIDNQLYTNLSSFEETSINAKDDFENIGVFIDNSDDGDFIEFYGTFDGEIFGDYITRLNNSGNGEYLVIHQLTITEQLPNTIDEYNLVGKYNPLTNTPDLGSTTFTDRFTSGDYWVATETGFADEINRGVNTGDFLIKNVNYPDTIKIEVVSAENIEGYSDVASFVRTSEQEIIQDDNFNDPNYFRPVLKFGGSALSYRIDYLLKLVNTTTNALIEKRGSFISFDPAQYGKSLIKINTRDNIQTFDVFNKRVINNITNTTTTNENRIVDSTLYNKNITSFKQADNVYAGSVNVTIDADGNIVSQPTESTTDVRAMGTSTVYISPFDTFLQFNIYQKIDESLTSIDLTKVGSIFMNFNNKEGEIIKVEATSNVNIDGSKGQTLFRITPDVYTQIINSGNDTFYITSKSGDNSPESIVYSGRYKDYSEVVTDEIELLISQQQNTIEDLNSQVTELASTNRAQSIELANLRDSVETLNTTLESLENANKVINEEEVLDNSISVKASPFNPFGTFSPTASSPTASAASSPTAS